jgi:hypothetical protein
MLSQWDCLLKNLGQWRGSFTRFSPRGELLEDTPTLVSLEGKDHHKTIHQLVRRFYPDRSPEDLILEYSSLNQSILFDQAGAFSQGSLYFSTFSSPFGAEHGMIDGERRARLVQLFNDRSEFQQLTLIRERLAGSDAPERPPLTVEQLLGEWRGEARTTDRSRYTAPSYPTRLTIERRGENQLSQKLQFGDRTIASIARIDGSRLLFEDSALPVQILLLPDGVSCNAPLKIDPGHRFVLEIGWLLSPTRRQRLVRSYSEKGDWTNITFITEEKVVS